MHFKRFILSIALTALVAGLLTACGPSRSTASANTLATNAGSSINAARHSSVVVSVGQVPSHQAVGVMLTVLTTTKGMTLYVHEWQGASGFSCDGICAKSWKPLVFKGRGTPTSTTPLPGKLSLGTDPQGQTVVFYQGYPLFTYVGDKVPGDFNAPLTDNSPWQPATINIPTGL